MKKICLSFLLILLFTFAFNSLIFAQDDSKSQQGDTEVTAKEKEFKKETYSILQSIATGETTAFNGMPAYLRSSLFNAGGEIANSIKKTLQYINSSDMKDLVALVSRDSNKVYTNKTDEKSSANDSQTDDSNSEGTQDSGETDTEGTDTAKQKPKVDEKLKARINFIQQLTGIEYNEDGFPIRDGKGIYTKTFQSEWMKKQSVKKVDVKFLTEVLLNGLVNKDPVVRMECLVILKAMGPHPIMLNPLLRASGREVNLSLSQKELDKEESGETVGNIDRAFFVNQLEVISHKYKYIDSDGVEKEGVPFLLFREFLGEVIRVDFVYKIERESDTEYGLERVTQTTLNNLTRDITYLEIKEYESPKLEKVSTPIDVSGKWNFNLHKDTGEIWFAGNLTINIEKLDDKYIVREFSIILSNNSKIALKETELKEIDVNGTMIWGFDETEASYKDENGVDLTPFLFKIFFSSDFNKIDDANSKFSVKGTDVWLKVSGDKIAQQVDDITASNKGSQTVVISEEYNYDNIPIYLYLDGKSAFKHLAGRSLLLFDNVDYSTINNDDLTETEMISIANSFVRGLKNRNYPIRIKIADFLYQFYYTHSTTLRTPTNKIKTIILRACIESKELRNALYKEIYQLFFPNKEARTSENLGTYLNSDEIEQLREAMGL